MIRLSSQPAGFVAMWAKQQCAAFKVIGPDFKVLGIEVDGKLGAAAFYDDFRAKDCNISVFIGDKRAVTRSMLREVFAYPFVTADLRRVTARVGSFNQKSKVLIEKLGFLHEGTRRCIYESGESELIYGMLREDCRWLTPFDRLCDPHTAGAY